MTEEGLNISKKWFIISGLMSLSWVIAVVTPTVGEIFNLQLLIPAIISYVVVAGLVFRYAKKKFSFSFIDYVLFGNCVFFPYLVFLPVSVVYPVMYVKENYL